MRLGTEEGGTGAIYRWLGCGCQGEGSLIVSIGSMLWCQYLRLAVAVFSQKAQLDLISKSVRDSREICE